MQQACRPVGGESRRGGERPRGRNETSQVAARRRRESSHSTTLSGVDTGRRDDGEAHGMRADETALAGSDLSHSQAHERWLCRGTEHADDEQDVEGESEVQGCWTPRPKPHACGVSAAGERSSRGRAWSDVLRSGRPRWRGDPRRSLRQRSKATEGQQGRLTTCNPTIHTNSLLALVSTWWCPRGTLNTMDGVSGQAPVALRNR